jgi:hypothetical protein
MAANNNIQISNLDFDSIKNNMKTFLKGQSKFQDYDFEGSGLSVLMDLLAYNTHYNAYYLNMIANEMFMDTATIRSSVVSHAKLLNYTPKSAQAPTAFITLQSNQVQASSLTLPKFTKFQSEAIDGVNYTFITKDSHTVNATANTVTFVDLEITQGEPISLSFAYSSATNSKQLFVLPDANIDTSTLLVQVQQSSTNLDIQTYNLAQELSGVNGNSTIYYLQEGLNGTYEIYFGDNILGKSLTDGNIVLVSYIVTSGTSAAGANNFVLLDSIASGNNIVYPLVAASQGSAKESIDSIKMTAPKAYASQGRAVTSEDYIAVLQNNNLGYSFDSVNVWSGVDETPPVYGRVFISIKPTGGYVLTKTQKDKIIDTIIKPVSVVTVNSTILDPDYTYLTINSKVLYDQKRTTLTSGQLQTNIKSSILDFSKSTLNTFNSTFSMADLITSIQNTDNSIIANEVDIKIQKKFMPVLGSSGEYSLNFGVELERGVYTSGINSTPTIQYYTPTGLLNNVYIEEVPFPSSGIDSIEILNSGFGYTKTPIITITGDGMGATAEAVVVNGQISKINLTSSGNNYTQAIVTVTNAPGDTTGATGSLYAKLSGQYGSLRTYYYDANNTKIILDSNIGTIDYFNGVITLPNFAPYDVNDPLGQLTITATPKSTIISSAKNRIITVDEYDQASISVNVTAK